MREDDDSRYQLHAALTSQHSNGVHEGNTKHGIAKRGDQQACVEQGETCELVYYRHADRQQWSAKDLLAGSKAALQVGLGCAQIYDSVPIDERVQPDQPNRQQQANGNDPPVANIGFGSDVGNLRHLKGFWFAA